MTPPQMFLTRWRVRLGYPIAIVCFWLAHPSPRSLLIGSALAVVGLINRGSAAGYLRKGRGLATSGPYSRTRNPLYFGSTILAAGFAVATGSWIAAACLASYIAVFYPAVMRREERDLRATYGAEFDAYAARVPLFFPSLRSAAQPVTVFPGRSTRAIANTRPPLVRLSPLRFCVSGCGRERSGRFRKSCQQILKVLVQPVNRGNQPPQFRAVQ